MLTERMILDLEKVQNESLRRLMGAFQSTSSMALEMISNVTPFRLRIQELCMKEWIKIQSLKENHSLRQMLNSEMKFFDGREGSPLGYLDHLSKELKKQMEEKKLKIPIFNKLTPGAMRNQEPMVEEQAMLKVDPR